MTYHELLESYVEASRAKKSYRRYRQIIDQHLKHWPTFPDFSQIQDWHLSLIATPHRANKALNILKATFTWAIRRGLYVGHNPATGVKRHATNSRERVMTSQEVALLLNCLDLIQHDKLSTLLLVLLLTGCRFGEALKMKRTDVNMVTGAWLQPETKNGRPHTTYLPEQVRRAIAKLPVTGDYVFMGVYLHHWSEAGAGKTWRQVRSALGLQDVRLHDFRRTLSTFLYDHTKDDFLVKRCINHVNKSVTAIYIRISQEAVAKALQAQADRFFALVNPPAPVKYTRRSSDLGGECSAGSA